MKSLPWLFSPIVDIVTFAGSAVLSLILLAVGAWLGLLHSDTPEWTWIVCILLVDVAHVYSSGFRVYFDRNELRRRPWLYGLTPFLSLLIGWSIYSESVSLFWSGLAYLAVFHFIRQQYGWVALYRSRGGETGRLGWWIDSSAIYLATVYPVVYWHANLPREFWWFRHDDFIAMPWDVSSLLAPLYWIALSAYAIRAINAAWRHRRFNPGKDIVVVTTAVCWYVGIIVFNSEYSFVVTNVIIHGIPYMVLVYWFSKRPSPSWHAKSFHLATFLGVIWILAYVEELLWDSSIGNEHPWMFGSHWLRGENLAAWETLLVPVLAVPQITHYVLDGFIWRRRSNPDLTKIVQQGMN